MNGLEDTLVTELITSSSGCADLSAPVLFSGEDLALVEMNGAARSRSTLRRGDDLREHLPPDDAHEVRALIHRQNAGHTVARIIKSREFSWALVIPRRFFGMNFGQFFLYKNKREMLSSQSFRSIVTPPRFSGGRGALYVNNETERVKLVKLNRTAHIDGTAALLDALTVEQKWWGEIWEQLENE